MKAASFLFVAVVLLGIAGCSPMNSGGDLFASGRDGRTYNPATGRYEWSGESERPRRRNKSAAVNASLRDAPPAAETPSDGRVYNLQKGRYEWSDSGTPGATTPAPR